LIVDGVGPGDLLAADVVALIRHRALESRCIDLKNPPATSFWR